MIEGLKRFASGYWFYAAAVFLFKTFVRLVYGLRVEGAELTPPPSRPQQLGERGLVVASNHFSSWDPPVMGVSVRRQVNYMAKKELFEAPAMQVLLAGLRAFPVDRSRNDIGAIKEAMRRLAEGRAIGIFAQGTRASSDAEALDGAAFLASRAKVPLQPAAVFREGRRFVVRFGEPIEPSGKSRADVRAATVELSRRINALLPESMPRLRVGDEETEAHDGGGELPRPDPRGADETAADARTPVEAPTGHG